MKKRKKVISKEKERVVLSDILPYELPATFTNRHFYEFLIQNEISFTGRILTWKKNGPALYQIVKLLFDVNDSNLIKRESDGEIEIKENEINKVTKTIPFSYKIAHNEKDFRELALIHPKNQLFVVDFYDKFKSLILYYSNISPFSLRHPFKIAKFTFYKDKTHFENFAHDHEHKTVEEFDEEYENLKTYFVYKEISNIYKFHESYKYHRCEKRYDFLFKFDISKCFESIYTHSICWALINKSIVKDKIGLSGSTFGGQFDKLMQNLNYGETNGIIIGPEFSRIFAEILLQQIDQEVKRQLKNQMPQIQYKVDYEIFRYVDDVFVFFNEDHIKEDVLRVYRLILKDFKLYINDAKSELIKKPIISGITIAKLRITDLLNETMSFHVKESTTSDDTSEIRYSFYVSSNSIITRFKTIIKESALAYQDIQNYTLACIDRKVHNLIDTFAKIDEKEKYETKVTQAFIEILDFAFFLYSVSPKVNSTIKLCMILSKVTKYIKIKGNLNRDNTHLILKKIYDDIFLVLKKYKFSEHTQVETLYLLIALKELGREYRLEENVLCKYYGLNLKELTCKYNLNYFSIIVLLFLIENKQRYSNTKRIIKKHILEKFESISMENRTKSTETILLLFDLLTCPYLDRMFKNKLLTLHGIESKKGILRSKIINYRESLVST